MGLKNFDVNINTNLIFRESPNFISVPQKANAGISKRELIERHTIAELERQDEDEDKEDEDKEKQGEAEL